MNNETLDVRDWNKRNAGVLGVVDINKNLTFRHNNISVKDDVIYWKLLLSAIFLNIHVDMNNSAITTKYIKESLPYKLEHST